MIIKFKLEYDKSSLIFVGIFSGFAFAQEDLLKDIDTIKTNTETSQPAFKALQIVTGQSTKLPAKKEWYMIVAHRFGDISAGFKDFLVLIMLLPNWELFMGFQTLSQ